MKLTEKAAQRGIVLRKSFLDLQRIVIRAFNELKELGESEYMARRAALRVFTLLEPELSPHLAFGIVAEWIKERSGTQ
jgi:hypothetical protein